MLDRLAQESVLHFPHQKKIFAASFVFYEAQLVRDRLGSKISQVLGTIAGWVDADHPHSSHEVRPKHLRDGDITDLHALFLGHVSCQAIQEVARC
jgi:hypothetical protein